MTDFKASLEIKGPRLFFILISLEVIFLTLLAVADITTNKYQGDDANKSIQYNKDQMYKWTILFIFVVSQYYYAWNAILKANVLELFAFIIISTATFVASFIRFYNLTSILLVQVFNYLYLSYAFTVLILSYICYRPFYDIFLYRNIMKVGASYQYQCKQAMFIKDVVMYRNYSNFSALIKLYFQISLCTFVSFFFYFDDDKWIDISIDLLMLLLLLVAIFFGYRGLNLESRIYLFVYATLITVIQIYVIAKMFLLIAGYNFSLTAIGVDLYTKLIIIVTTTSCIAIMILNFYYVLRCEQEFGKGLKEVLLQSRTQSMNDQ